MMATLHRIGMTCPFLYFQNVKTGEIFAAYYSHRRYRVRAEVHINKHHQGQSINQPGTITMSIENLKKYGILCTQDETVREKAKAIGLQDIPGQITYATSLGLPFTHEDMAALAKEVGANQKDELSEEDLEKVAGGIVSTTALAIAGGVVSAGAAVGGMVTGATGKW